MDFEELLKLKDFDSFGIDESLQIIGDLINSSLDMKRMVGLDHALATPTKSSVTGIFGRASCWMPR